MSKIDAIPVLIGLWTGGVSLGLFSAALVTDGFRWGFVAAAAVASVAALFCAIALLWVWP